MDKFEETNREFIKSYEELPIVDVGPLQLLQRLVYSVLRSETLSLASMTPLTNHG